MGDLRRGLGAAYEHYAERVPALMPRLPVRGMAGRARHAVPPRG